MTPLIRVNPRGFVVPAEMDPEIMARCLPGREKDIDDSDKVGALFIKQQEQGGIGWNSYGSEPASAWIFELMHREKRDSMSQRLGVNSHWAHMLLRFKDDPFDVAIFTLKDLGFSDEEIVGAPEEFYGNAKVRDVTERASKMGLRLCPQPLVSALLLSSFRLVERANVVIMTEHLDLSCLRAGPGATHPWRYWRITNCKVQGMLLESTSADPEANLFTWGGVGSWKPPGGPGTRRVGLHPFGMMFVVPPGTCGLPAPQEWGGIANEQQAATGRLGNRTEVLTPFLRLEEREAVLV